MQSCPVCGTQVAQDQSFCNRCGACLIPSARDSTVTMNPFLSELRAKPTWADFRRERYSRNATESCTCSGVAAWVRSIADDLLLGQPVEFRGGKLEAIGLLSDETLPS